MTDRAIGTLMHHRSEIEAALPVAPALQSGTADKTHMKPTPPHMLFSLFNSVVGESSGVRHPINSRIDYTKYKTRLCRHFIRGLSCPFRDRCAFSHGEEIAAMMLKQRASVPSSPPESRASADSESQQQSHEQLQPPPSYEASSMFLVRATTTEIFLPPSYPRRYRFDPYSPHAIAYVRV
ncbi:zinc finger protein ZFP1 [Leptomonas seymouri]|uniref:Zinc finger protein ZFP1 n=1 Tax=Leptomonas seymouri TaxID=5684 RepID=A0A0N1PGD1_LEPSE|nr:zinc finger protein ZFP1 [Leptomonas seymouri]|eukprot:KPI90183.1 zinc finger protein ZFP1 [Leptomonas seymouri]